MMRKQELLDYNERVKTQLKEKYSKINMGFFNNNHILFVGQIPTNNFEDEFKNIYDYKIGSTIKDLVGKNWNHISFTSLIKIPTVDYFESNQELVNEFLPILKKQISLLNPTLVILLGEFSGKQFGITEYLTPKKLDGINYVMIRTASELKSEEKYEAEIIQIKKFINEFLKLNALVKVTNYHYIYRDIEFNKRLEYHSYSDWKDNGVSYCFIKSDEPTEYRSYDGYYLKKVPKSEATDFNSYERHLTGKHIFYYNNYHILTHSKMLRYMLFDIENDFCNDIKNPTKPVTTIAYYDNLNDEYNIFVYKFSKEQIINTKFKDVNIKEFNDEVSMLKAFFTECENYDLLSGWYSDGFDIPYLLNRAILLGIKLNEFFKYIHVNIELNGDVRIHQQSHIFYDALAFYKMNVYYNKPPSYSLNSVAKFLFGDDVKKIEHRGVDVLWREDINKLIEYNVQDVYLLKKIVDKSNIINYPLQLQQICPQDFENVFFNSLTIENLLHYRYWNKKVFFPTKVENDKPEYEGAIVITPVSGLHQNVAAYDFSAMYTNIYLSMNFSPDTLVGEKVYVENNFDEIKKNLLSRYEELKEKFNSYTSKEDILSRWILIKNDFGEFYFLPHDWKLGVLPKLESEMLNYRKLYTSIRDSYEPHDPEYKIYDELQGTAKTILNSIYGVAAFKKFILFNTIIPASITSTARQLNLWVQQLATQNNLQPLYGDTDSIFVKFDSSLSFDEFNREASNFNILINNSFKEFTKQFTNNEYVINNCHHKIDFEKAYSKILLTKVKKRYFGYLKIYKGKILEEEKFSVTGFETRRDDTPIYFKKILLDSYKILLEHDYKNKFIEMFKQISKDIRNVPIEELIIKIKLSNDLEEYKNIPIHIRALNNSKTTIRRGELVNMVYVKECGVAHYIEGKEFNFTIDYETYLENFFINKIKLIDDTISVYPTLDKWF